MIFKNNRHVKGILQCIPDAHTCKICRHTSRSSDITPKSYPHMINLSSLPAQNSSCDSFPIRLQTARFVPYHCSRNTLRRRVSMMIPPSRSICKDVFFHKLSSDNSVHFLQKYSVKCHSCIKKNVIRSYSTYHVRLTYTKKIIFT